MTAIVIVVRDPDYENQYAIFDGDVEVHDIDLGRGDLTNRDEWLGWAASHLRTARAIQDEHPAAADHIRAVVWEYENHHWLDRDQYRDEFGMLDDAELIALADKEGV